MPRAAAKTSTKKSHKIKNTFLFIYFFLLRATTCAICLRGATFGLGAPGRGARRRGRQIWAILRGGAWEGGTAARRNRPTSRWREAQHFIRLMKRQSVTADLPDPPEPPSWLWRGSTPFSSDAPSAWVSFLLSHLTITLHGYGITCCSVIEKVRGHGRRVCQMTKKIV